MKKNGKFVGLDNCTIFGTIKTSFEIDTCSQYHYVFGFLADDNDHKLFLRKYVFYNPYLQNDNTYNDYQIIDNAPSESYVLYNEDTKKHQRIISYYRTENSKIIYFFLEKEMIIIYYFIINNLIN